MTTVRRVTHRLRVSAQGVLTVSVLVATLLGACTIAPEGRASPLAESARWAQITGAGPLARWGHVAAFDPGRNRVLVWGGTDTRVTFDDLWAFSLDSNTWRELSAPGGPPGRTTAAAVVDAARDRMIVVGGSGAGNEVWSLDLARLTWVRLPSGPSARFDLAATANDTKAWFFGGFSAQDRALDDLWQLDLATDTWRQLPAPTGRPAPTTNVGFGLVDDHLIVSGGHDESEVTPGTWSYDLAAGAWTRLTEANTPFAKAHYASATDAECGFVWLMGGDNNDFKDSGELLGLEPEPTATFFPLASAGPSKRRHATVTFDPAGRRLVLFGGWQGLPEILGDTWVATAPPCSSPG